MSVIRKCRSCGNEIHPLRLKVLPDTEQCQHCSQAARVAGFPLITGKTTYSEIQLVDQETANRLHRLQDRKGSICTGIQWNDRQSEASKEDPYKI